MAWRLSANLIDGELDNRTPFKVTGWMRFFRRDMDPLRITLELMGNFGGAITGKRLRLINHQPSDENIALGREGTSMEGFAPVQHGAVGEISTRLVLGPMDEALSQLLISLLEQMWDLQRLDGSERERRRRNIAATLRERSNEAAYFCLDTLHVRWLSDSDGEVVLELDPSQVVAFD